MVDSITFTGKIEKIVFYKDSFGVLLISSEEDIPHSKKTSQYDFETNSTKDIYMINVTGKIPSPELGQTWNVTGYHKYHSKYGNQYIIEKIVFSAPQTVSDAKAYLESILTPNQAETLISVYPNIVQDVIDGKEEVDLSSLKGFGQATWDRVKNKIIENFAISDVLSLLIPLGISMKKIEKLLGGEDGNPQILMEKLKGNPYILSQIDGITFKTVDKIATQLNEGLKESEERLIAFLDYYLGNLANEKGHTWSILESIRNEVIGQVPEVEKFLEQLILKEIETPKFLFVQDEKIGLKKFRDDEVFIFEKAVELGNSVPLEITQQNIDDGIRIAEEIQGFPFTEEQKEIIINMTKSNFCLQTGKSGTGKTTTARGLLNIYKCAGYDITVGAFSAKAAKRAVQATGFRGSTLHKLLGLGKGRVGNGATESFDVYFLDESSMNPLFLMKEIFRLVNKNSNIKIILCGDSKQIVPLGVGNIFSDLLGKDCFNKNVLTKIQRQAEKSGMICDGNMIREGIDPIEKKETRIVHGENKDLIYLFRSDKDEIFRIAVNAFVKSVKEKGVGNSVILVPFKTKGLNCTKNFNKAVREQVNSENKDVKFVHGDMEYWLNDFVINVKNNYDKDIMNGSLGFITNITASGIAVDFDGQEVGYTHEDIFELELAYALSLHKFQGSETLDAIVVMDSSHYVLMNNSWLYTGLTRARERCLVVTDVFAYDRCMREDATMRNTWLKEMENVKNDVDNNFEEI